MSVIHHSLTLPALLMAVAFIAHRGASHDAPENTLAALRLGYEQGADAAECDVHLSRDGRIVLHHDADTGRSAGLHQPVAAQSFTELQSLNVAQWGQWRGSAFSEKIPELSAALALVPAGKRLFVELKIGAEILPELERVLRASGLAPAQVALITFELVTARAAKQRLPAHEVCWIAEPPARLAELIAGAKAAGLDGLDLSHRYPIDAAFVQQVRAAGLKLYTWTVDDPTVARTQAAAGIDGITTNRPGWLRAQLAA